MAEVSSQIKPIINALIFGDSLYQVPLKQANIAIAETDTGTSVSNLYWGSPSSFALATINAFSENNRSFDLMKSIAQIDNGKFTAENKSNLDDASIEKIAINNYKNKIPVPQKTTTEIIAGDNTFLTRMIIVSTNVTKLYGTDFVNNEKAMDEIHGIVALTHNYLSAMVAGGFICVLVSQLITNANSNMTVDNSLSLIYEYYSTHEVFAPELNNFSSLNLPGFKDTNRDSLNTDMNCFHTIENAIWVVDRSKNVQDALKNGLKVKEKNSVLMCLVAVIAMCHFNQQDYFNDKVKLFENADEIERISTEAERSRKFI